MKTRLFIKIFWSSSTIILSALPSQTPAPANTSSLDGTQKAPLTNAASLDFYLLCVLALHGQEEKLQKAGVIYIASSCCIGLGKSWRRNCNFTKKRIKQHVLKMPHSPPWTVIRPALPLHHPVVFPLFLICIMPITCFWTSETVSFILNVSQSRLLSQLARASITKYPQLGGLNNRNFISPMYFQFWRLEVQSQGVSKVGSS